ncbi:DUF6636 domain-containing protein [Falsiroseomonas sp.]|uniref:DUF6636 domain-containing protein n=1 Tax=Falsiroseomonas sp. TaxID=2870721 RepID=UPI002720ACB3|nr:DUF6636 domain-containing protein [Falsiroseomonas sp.]MDO9499914.1 hypothetical protein [Falsiroseomonas sp.]
MMTRWVAALALLLPGLAAAEDGFRLPSGNIRCGVWEGVLRCEAMQFSYRPPPRPADCDLEWGGAIELGRRGPAAPVCHGDTVTDPKAPVLAYGGAWQGEGLSCSAAPQGLRCSNAEGRGFEMARARLRLF